MRIQSIWKEEFSKEIIQIHAHPENKDVVNQLKERMEAVKTIIVLDEKKNIKVKVNMNRIEYIETYAHMTRVYLIDDEKKYVIQKRLKDLEMLEQDGIQRINNTTMLNINQIEYFEAIGNARLEVTTKTNKKYIVSRYYAKKMKENL